MQTNNDQEQRVMLMILMPVLVLVVGGVLGLGVFKATGSSTQSVVQSVVQDDRQSAVFVEADVPPLAAEPSANDASIVVYGGVVKFYFASGSADLAVGAGAALADTVVAAKAGNFVVLSGFHDDTGDAAFNAALAQRRAMAVRASLLMAGAPEDRVVLKKPEVLAGSGSNAQARRVEVVVSANSVQ